MRDGVAAPPGRLTAPALRRALDILELFLEPNEGLRVPEITERLRLPRASVHELVRTLAERGYLEQEGGDQHRFTLGVKAFQLGGAYERELDLMELARSAARAVAAQCGETVQVAIRDDRYAVYIARVDSTYPVRLVSDVGRRLPAHCTAGGKALLADLPPAELGVLFPDAASLAPMTPASIDSLDRLNQELAVVRERGWADEYCESNPDVTCVAAPIYRTGGACVAAMSISVPVLRWDEARKAELVELVTAGTRELSTRLGAPPRS